MHVAPRYQSRDKSSWPLRVKRHVRIACRRHGGKAHQFFLHASQRFGSADGSPRSPVDRMGLGPADVAEPGEHVIDERRQCCEDAEGEYPRQDKESSASTHEELAKAAGMVEAV